MAWGQSADPGKKKLTLEQREYTGDEATPKESGWMEQVRHPVKGLTLGADQRLRLEYFDNAITLNGKAKGHEWDFGRFRTRIWGQYAPCKEFEVGVRLAWEWRHWQEPDSKPEWQWYSAFFDNLYATVRPMPNLSIKIGRQDIILGDGWLVLEGTPLDGSTSIYFDAVRATYAMPDCKTTVEAIYIQQYASPDIWLPTINDNDINQIEQNERGVILYVTNKSLPQTQIDGYFIYKHNQPIALPTPDPTKVPLTQSDMGDIYTPGFRVVHNFDAHWTGRVEAAYQFGGKNGRRMDAWGLNSRLTYNCNDDWKNQVYMGFEYLSGDKPGDKTNQQFDPLWGRWPQFSELYVYSYAQETRIAETTNLLRFGPGYTVFPTKQLELNFTYNALFANENTLRGRSGFASHGNFRGSLFTAIGKYKFNEHASAHLWGEYFVPGNYYDSNKGDSAVYLRAELVLTF